MAFGGLTDKLSSLFKNLRSKGRLTEDDIKLAMREIRLALLEADVNFKVAKDFISAVSEKAVGKEVLEGLNPTQQLIKIVNDELIRLMGNENAKLTYASKPPTVILFVGLQGSGKTTNIAKLAGLLQKKENKRPLLVACDIYRPAAIDQLKIVGEKLGIPVFSMDSKSPAKIAEAAIKQAEKAQNDVVLIDTAGRLHIDEALMAELGEIKNTVHPQEILLVIDAMTGQDAINVATEFNNRLELSGLVLTKLDGDSRGGAALSALAVTGKPIKFVGTGEKLDNIDFFYPERMASRILDMGDVMSIIEKAQENFDEKKARELEEKIRKNTFTLADYLDQMHQMRNMGSMNDLLSMLPGAKKMGLGDVQVDEKVLDRLEAIISSMTPKERNNPSLLNYSRKTRIAKGSGTELSDINKLLKQYEMTKDMMKKMTGGNMKKLQKQFGGKFPFSM